MFSHTGTQKMVDQTGMELLPLNQNDNDYHGDPTKTVDDGSDSVSYVYPKQPPIWIKPMRKFRYLRLLEIDSEDSDSGAEGAGKKQPQMKLIQVGIFIIRATTNTTFKYLKIWMLSEIFQLISTLTTVKCS